MTEEKRELLETILDVTILFFSLSYATKYHDNNTLNKT